MKALALINEAVVQEQLYKLSSTQVNLPSAHADFVLKWGREMIPNEQLYYDDKGGLGREDEIHVTVLYGLVDKVPSKELLALIKKTPPFTARLTSVTLFDNNPDYDVVKFDVDCEELVSLSNAIRQACPNENKYPDYHPHCTIAYVKKGRVPDLAGNYPFQQNPPIPAEFEVNEILFKPAGDSGDPNRKPIRIPLNRYRQEAEDPKAALRAVGAKEQPRLVDGFHYADVTWEDIHKLRQLKKLGTFDGRAFRLVSENVFQDTRADAETVLGRKLRWYRWITVEAEDPKAVFKKIPRPPDFTFSNDGSVVLITPNHPDADKWLHDTCPEDAQFFGGSMVVEPRYMRGVAIAMADDGWTTNVTLHQEAEDPKVVLKKAKEAKSRKDNGGVLVLPPTRGRLLPARPVRLMGEAETPQMAMKLKRITRALMFKHVPEGFYFRSPWYPLVKKQLDPESGCNAVTADLDMVRPLKFPPDYWVFPVEWTTNDITNGQRLESFLGANPLWLPVLEEGLDEAEDPKTVFRLATAGAHKFYVTRNTDAYGKWLAFTHYLKVVNDVPVWTGLSGNATPFHSAEDAEAAVIKHFGTGFDVPVNVVRGYKIGNREFTTPIGEAEDPRRTLKQSAKDAFVVWSYSAGVTYFLRLEKRWGQRTFMWTQEQHMASRFRTQEAAEAFKQEFYPPGTVDQFNVRVSTVSQALAYRGESEDPKAVFKRATAKKSWSWVKVCRDADGNRLTFGYSAQVLGYDKERKLYKVQAPDDPHPEWLRNDQFIWHTRVPVDRKAETTDADMRLLGEGEDPKHFLKTVAGTLPEKRFRVNWLDQHGYIHYTAFGVPSAEAAVAHLKSNLERVMCAGRGAYTISDIISVDDISDLKEAEDPKAAFRLATRRLSRPTRYKNVPDGFYFKFNHEDPTECVKLRGEAFRIDNMVNPYWPKSMVNDVYVCYPPSWSYEKIKAHSRHISRHPEAFHEAEDPKAVFRKIGQVVEIPLKGPGIIVGRWKGGSSDSAWSYWGDFPEGWGWSPRLSDATVLRHNQLRPTIERIQRESPDQALRVLPVHNRPHLEAREPSPFDLLNFPTDASVLAAKLLDLEHDVKPAVL